MHVKEKRLVSLNATDINGSRLSKQTYEDWRDAGRRAAGDRPVAAVTV
jgi:hypothetical protein